MSIKPSKKTQLLPNGEEIFYRQLGHGAKVLCLLHGNYNASINWDVVMETLSQEKYTMVAIDLRGFGHSSYTNEVNHIRDFAEDLHLFLKQVGLKLDVLMGWSAGGAVALQYAALYPGTFDQLILLSSASISGYPIVKRTFWGKPKPGQLVTTREEIAKQTKVIRRAMGKKNKPFLKKLLNMSLYALNQPDENRYDAYLDEMVLQRNLVDVNFALMTFNISHAFNGVVEGTGEVDKITAKTLILQGDSDKIITSKMAQETCDALGEKAQLVTLKNCGHVAPVDDLKGLVEAVEGFING